MTNNYLLNDIGSSLPFTCVAPPTFTKQLHVFILMEACEKANVFQFFAGTDVFNNMPKVTGQVRVELTLEPAAKVGEAGTAKNGGEKGDVPGLTFVSVNLFIRF